MLKRLTLLAALAATAMSPALAQKRQPSPEERIERLEKQVNQVQRRVYGKQPVDTAGYVLDPAVTQSEMVNVTTRLDSIERQMADLVRTSEENSNRVATLEAQIAQMRAAADRRERETPVDEPGSGDDMPVAAAVSDGPPPAPRPKVETRRNDPPVTVETASNDTAADPAEAAYDRGYQLWMQKKYDAAATALRAFPQQYPGHRRVSWANNLRGRALLDKGDYRGAAEVLLANYRGDKDGERAQDSLYYLGQASLKLGQPQQACRAYAELENVYAANMRPAVRSMLPAAKAAARCN
jgi:TolA-binding protein